MEEVLDVYSPISPAVPIILKQANVVVPPKFQQFQTGYATLALGLHSTGSVATCTPHVGITFQVE